MEISREFVIRAGKAAYRRGRAAAALGVRVGRRGVSAVAGTKSRATHNADFFALVRGAADAVPGDDTSARALRMLARRARAQLEDPRTSSSLRLGLIPWHLSALNLAPAALAAAHEALAAGRLAEAEGLATHLTGPRGTRREAVWILARIAAGRQEWGNLRRVLARVGGGQEIDRIVSIREAAANLDLVLEASGHGADARSPEQLYADAVRLRSGLTTGAAGADAAGSARRAFRSALASRDDLDQILAYSSAAALEPLLRTDGGDLSEDRGIFEAAARLADPSEVSLAPEAVAATVNTMNLKSFRNHLFGKSICLVANSSSLLTSGLGPQIDAYDLVMRFNSFSLQPEHTGGKTDIHVVIHMHDYNFDVPVDVRIVLSGKQELWTESIKRHVRPGAQNWLGDSSLRWPARNLGLINPWDKFRTPTAGFNLLRLLLHLDVNPVIDLYGFDFYASGSSRLKGAMSIAHSPAHNSAAEKAWVYEHATAVEEHLIRMKGIQK
jgi:hypothetical protein